MPMIWNDANNARFFALVLKVSDIKLSSAHVEEIARQMGDECTAKAISHRLTKLRKDAAAGGDEANASPPALKAKAAAKGGRKRKNATRTPKAEGEDDGETEGKGLGTPPSSAAKRRGKKVKLEEDPNDAIEVGEDVGEGLRKSGSEDGQVGEEEVANGSVAS